jgi:nitrate reductase cytochrome c-type subunit
MKGLKYQGLDGKDYVAELIPHDISKYEVLFHVTLKDRVESIKEHGLLINSEKARFGVEVPLLWFSYPIDMDTSDCFRWHDEDCALVMLDVSKLKDIEFFDDYWGMIDKSSKRNHLCCEVNIPKEAINKILTF